MYRQMCRGTVLSHAYRFVKSLLLRYPAPASIGYLWNFGSLAGIFLVVQLLSGLFLSMFYTPSTEYAFSSVEHIMRDVNFGWLIRYIHANGASFFFLVVYLHMFRGLFYGSYHYPRNHVWFAGVAIYLSIMATAFLGYVLPWGQMSFWAATVITNFITVVPVLGEDIVYWVWGGYALNNATLNRFFSLHYLLPFIVTILVLLHSHMLHQSSSTTELRVRVDMTMRVSFYPYFAIKDLFTLLLIISVYCVVVFYTPEVFNHSVNYIPANMLVTPSHIVPEWYFLPYYAILRSILNKTVGIICPVASVSFFVIYPIIHNGDVVHTYTESFRRHIWCWLCNLVMLGFIGSQTAEFPCVEFGTICTMMHFYLCIEIVFVNTIAKAIFAFAVDSNTIKKINSKQRKRRLRKKKRPMKTVQYDRILYAFTSVLVIDHGPADIRDYLCWVWYVAAIHTIWYVSTNVRWRWVLIVNRYYKWRTHYKYGRGFSNLYLFPAKESTSPRRIVFPKCYRNSVCRDRILMLLIAYVILLTDSLYDLAIATYLSVLTAILLFPKLRTIRDHLMQGPNAIRNICIIVYINLLIILDNTADVSTLATYFSCIIIYATGVPIITWLTRETHILRIAIQIVVVIVVSYIVWHISSLCSDFDFYAVIDVFIACSIGYGFLRLGRNTNARVPRYTEISWNRQKCYITTRIFQWFKRNRQLCITTCSLYTYMFVALYSCCVWLPHGIFIVLEICFFTRHPCVALRDGRIVIVGIFGRLLLSLHIVIWMLSIFPGALVLCIIYLCVILWILTSDAVIQYDTVEYSGTRKGCIIVTYVNICLMLMYIDNVLHLLIPMIIILSIIIAWYYIHQIRTLLLRLWTWITTHSIDVKGILWLTMLLLSKLHVYGLSAWPNILMDLSIVLVVKKLIARSRFYLRISYYIRRILIAYGRRNTIPSIERCISAQLFHSIIFSMILLNSILCYSIIVDLDNEHLFNYLRWIVYYVLFRCWTECLIEVFAFEFFSQGLRYWYYYRKCGEYLFWVTVAVYMFQMSYQNVIFTHIMITLYVITIMHLRRLDGRDVFFSYAVASLIWSIFGLLYYMFCIVGIWLLLYNVFFVYSLIYWIHKLRFSTEGVLYVLAVHFLWGLTYMEFFPYFLVFVRFCEYAVGICFFRVWAVVVDHYLYRITNYCIEHDRLQRILYPRVIIVHTIHCALLGVFWYFLYEPSGMWFALFLYHILMILLQSLLRVASRMAYLRPARPGGFPYLYFLFIYISLIIFFIKFL